MKNKIIFIIKILILVLLFGWIVMVFTDYFRVRQSKSPMFCLNNTVKDYSDGSVSTCMGLGYKVVKYDRTCLYATEFGPFFIKERQCENNN